jgi:hypothetical protein
MSSRWESIVGLEIHAQINAASKLFSNAPTSYNQPVNSQVNINLLHWLQNLIRCYNNYIEDDVADFLPVIEKVQTRNYSKSVMQLLYCTTGMYWIDAVNGLVITFCRRFNCNMAAMHTRSGFILRCCNSWNTSCIECQVGGVFKYHTGTIWIRASVADPGSGAFLPPGSGIRI